VSWQTVALGDVCKTSAGGTPLKAKKEYYEGGNIPWLLSGEVCKKEIFSARNFITDEGVENSSAKIFPKDTTLIAMYGATAGQVSILRFPSATNQAVCGILPNKNYTPEFLYYFLSYYKETLLLEVSGVAQPNLSQVKIKNIPLPKIGVNTQSQIVTKLDAIFAEIDKATAAAEANAKNAEALFQSYMSKVFNECENTFGTSELSSICDLQNGYAFKSADYVDLSNTLNIRMSSIRPGGFFDAEHNKRYLPDSYAVKYKDFLLNDGDLVIAMTDMAGDPKILGVPTIVKDLKERMFLMNQRVGKIHKFSDLIDVSYLRYFLTSPKLKEFYKSKGDGGLQINISKKDILSANIPIPPIQTQKSIGKDMSFEQENSEKLRFSYLRKAGELKSLKQSILTQAFNGELVKE
jgi:type I restriction enzyme S subunit